MILDIQRRHAQVYRIRLGDRANGRPQKLTDSIRVTSPSRTVVDAFCAVYGGESAPWSEPATKDKWEAYLPTTELAIMVLPGQSIDQWWEKWDRSVCARRCDGYTEQLTGKPCVCALADEGDLAVRMKDTKSCRPMTRLSVLCPDVECVGAGSLVTHGLIAAETLPQSVAVAEAALSRGMMVPAVLRVVEHRGKTHFVVPLLEIVGVSYNQLASGEVRAGVLQPANGSSLKAIPSGEPGPSVAAQAKAIEGPKKAAAPRKNAAAPIPATGLKPRTAAEAGQGVTVDDHHELMQALQGLSSDQAKAFVAWRKAKRWNVPPADPAQAAEMLAKIRALVTTEPGPTGPEAAPADAPLPDSTLGAGLALTRQRAFFAHARDLGIEDTVGDDGARHALISWATDGAVFSSTELGDNGLWDRVETALGQVAVGKAAVVRQLNGSYEVQVAEDLTDLTGQPGAAGGAA